MSAFEDPPILSGDDAAVVAGQLERTPRDVTGVAVRCRFGFPVVIETAAILSDGSPNPTLLYLTCPALSASVSGIEAGGGVRAFRTRCGDDRALRRIVDEVTALYRARRADLAEVRAGRDAGVAGSEDREANYAGYGARLEAGIGGPAVPEKASCLHAYAAALLAIRSGWLSEQAGEGDRDREIGDLTSRVARLWVDVFPGLEEPWCRDSRCARWSGRSRLAVIDVGTISVRLLVADVLEGVVWDIVRRAEVTRLGEGLRKNGRLSPIAKERTGTVVKRFLEEAWTDGAESITLVGTSACRDAEDGLAFIQDLGAPAGPGGTLSRIDAFVLTGEQEAEFTYGGASSIVSGDAVVLDVGGGSTELIHKGGDGLLDAVSLDVGAGRATEKTLPHDPPDTDEIGDVYREARARFDGYRCRFGPKEEEDEGGCRTLVAVAGTVTTLACLDAGLEVYDRNVVHGHELSRESVSRLLDDLAGMTVAERAARPCVQSGRAPVIVAGAAILLAAMDSLGFDRLVVSERDLLDGLAIHAAGQASGRWVP